MVQCGPMINDNDLTADFVFAILKRDCLEKKNIHTYKRG